MPYYRTAILNNLIHRVNSFSEGYRQNIAIIGEPCIGKTSLIKNLLSSDKIKKDAVIPIYLEIKIEPFEFCAKRFIKSALFQLLQSDPLLATSHDTVLLIEDLRGQYPKTAQICIRVLQDIEKNRFDEAFSFMMDITATIFEESKKRCILILDEFHNLGNFMLKHPFGTLAKKIMLQKGTMYLLVSSKNTISQRLLSEKLSMLFGNFEKVLLPPFDLNASRSFLQENIKGVTFPQAYLDFIASFTGSRPLYMQLICDEIERIVFSKKAFPEDYVGLIECALTEAIFKKTGTINQHFYNLFFKISDGKLLSKSAAVLIALSSENKKQQDIVKSSNLQARDVSRILSRLLEMDVIARNGSFYRFKDKLFSFWLQSVYLKRLLSFSIDESLEKNIFKKAAMNKLNVFMQELEKELSSRVIELFRLFKNDVIQLNGRKHKFPLFGNVQKLEDSASRKTTSILATEGKLKWLCTIKKEYVTENDITEAIKKIGEDKQNNRINRHVLVSLAGINENAYLLAKEAKFWVWDPESLNVLMELYGKPHIA
ncbi:ATP-binding protein [Candidatus Omnitrophota bacterium]